MKISEKFKKLSFKDKIDYLWDYYKVPIIGAITAVVLIVYILYLVFRHVPEDVLNVTLINSAVTSESEVTLDDEYISFAGYDPYDYQVSIGAYITIDNGMTGKAREFMAAKILAEEIDILFWDNEALDYVKTLEASADLEDYMPESYIEKYKNYAIYENESLIGFSFDSKTDITKKLVMKESYVGMIGTAANKDEAVKFIEYLLDTNYGSEN